MTKAKKENKAKAESKSAKPATPAAPQIDTAHAAASAAAMIAGGMGGAVTPQSGGKESAAFKQLKEAFNKPPSTLGNALDKSGLKGGKHSHLPFGHAGKQVGRNQTFGADVNRSGVPRRTGG